MIQRALREAARQAALAHHRAGVPMVIFEDGEIREVPASKILKRLRKRR